MLGPDTLLAPSFAALLPQADRDVAAWRQAVALNGGDVSGPEIARANTLVKTLKSIVSGGTSSWDRALDVHLLACRDPVASLTTLKRLVFATPNHDPTFSVSRGWSSVTDLQTADPQPGIGSIFTDDLLSATDHFIATATLDDLAADSAGLCGTDHFLINPRSVAGELRVKSGSTTTDVLAVPAARGFQYINRKNSSAAFDLGHVDFGASPTHTHGTKSRTSGTLGGQSWGLCLWNGGAANQFSSRRIAFHMYGAALDDSQVLPTLAAARAWMVDAGALNSDGSMPPPIVNQIWSMAPTQDGIQVTGDLTEHSDDVCLVVATGPNDASIVYTSDSQATASTLASTTTVNSSSYESFAFTVTGLPTPYRRYWYKLQIDGVIDSASGDLSRPHRRRAAFRKSAFR